MVEKEKDKKSAKEKRSTKLIEHLEEQNTILKKMLTELDHKNGLLHKKNKLKINN